MGASEFINIGVGATPEEAFECARQYALEEMQEDFAYEYPEDTFEYDGYSGTIYEKEDFEMVFTAKPLTVGEAFDRANEILTKCSELYTKYGPAGCIPYTGGYVFFGLAAS
jgi:hypothetical protein